MEAQAIHIHSELINRCRQGDREAYYKLYKLYSRSMYNVGFRIVNNTEEAEDVLQEAFTSAFRNLHHYRGDSTFGAWLKRIVINKAINYLHKRKAERMPEDERWDVHEEEEENILEGFPFSVEQVRSAIERLPDGYRSVLSLYLLEGYDHAEIGEIMGITESTSKSQFNRAKKKLKDLLEEGVK
ncbi:MAG: RNA polymerase sigma factor [Cytophagales bacterium]|nr:RNA polymerase sigma factor [Cytophagales bacterium]HRE68728.1 RNA polymerase sigma factor [Cyclobacteriaceae bacterium]